MPDKPELKVKEYETFMAFYCGVCKSIGKRYGIIPRFTLSYDAVFLAILLLSLEDKNPDIGMKRCIVHPLKKRCIILNNKIIDYSADINIILSYYNLEDDKRDDNSIKANAGSVILRPVFKKIKKKYAEKCGIIEAWLKELAILENNRCASIDMVAEPFAKILEEVAAYKPLCKDTDTEKVIRWIGYNLGKWIYILDAYDDMEEDLKDSNYNPFLCKERTETKKSRNMEETTTKLYDISKANETDKLGRTDKISELDKVKEIKEQIRGRVEFNLIHSLDQIGKAYELLHTKNVKGLLENIIYLGMYKKTEKILGTGSCWNIESI